MEAILGTILWRPGVGDPTVVGWVTTVGYGVAAALCVRAGFELNNKETKERSAERGLRIEDGGSKVRDGETAEHRTLKEDFQVIKFSDYQKGELNNEGTGDNDECSMTTDEGMGLHRAECGTNTEGTKERSGEGMVKHALPRGSRAIGYLCSAPVRFD